jgi:predicted aconitase
MKDKERVGETQPEVAEAAEIWRRWAAHLNNCRQKFAAALVLIAVGAWHKAAELLVQQQMHDAAALLLRAAEENGLHHANDTTQLDFMVRLPTILNQMSKYKS